MATSEEGATEGVPSDEGAQAGAYFLQSHTLSSVAEEVCPLLSPPATLNTPCCSQQSTPPQGVGYNGDYDVRGGGACRLDTRVLALLGIHHRGAVCVLRIRVPLQHPDALLLVGGEQTRGLACRLAALSCQARAGRPG